MEIILFYLLTEIDPKMLKPFIFCVLSVTILLLDHASAEGRTQRQLFKKGGHWIPKIPLHSIPVPFWQHRKMGNVTCDQFGYFPFPRTCDYFVKCAAFLPGHFFRFVYKCTDDRVYSIKHEACVRPSDSDRVECGRYRITEGMLADSSDIKLNDKVDDLLSEIEEKLLYTDHNLTCNKEGFFGVPNNCSQFYRCALFGNTFTKYDFSCPKGTVWDSKVKTCNFRTAVKELECTDQGNRELQLIPLQKPCPEVTLCPGHSLTEDQHIYVCPTAWRRHPKYCNLMYQCWMEDDLKTHVTITKCPINSTFDEAKIQCVEDRPPEKDCQLFDVTTYPQLTTVIHTDPLCPTTGNNPHSQDPCDRLYISCKINAKGRMEALLMSCHTGSYSIPHKDCMILPEGTECK